MLSYWRKNIRTRPRRRRFDKFTIMYPYPLFFGLGFYELFLIIGICAAMLMLRKLTVRAGLSAGMHNLILGCSVLAIVGGYFASILTQAVYNYLDDGVFALNRNTGSTFLGGFCGGAVLFLAVYFLAGRFGFRDREPLRRTADTTDCMSVCVPLAHAFGRLGCLMAGCCYGKEVSWGVYLPVEKIRVIPVPLFESIFLFALTAFLYRTTARTPGSGIRRYLILYGIARFLLEFLRGDDRGVTIVPFLTPSQLTSLILIVIGLALVLLSRRKKEVASA